MSAMIHRILSFVAAALLLVAAHSVVAQTNLTGDWNVAFETPQGPTNVRVTITQDGDKVAGLFKTPMGELPFDGTVSGDDLKFEFPYMVQGQAITISVTGKVDGSTIAGKAIYGSFGEGDWKATRVETDSSAASGSVPPAASSSAAHVDGASGSSLDSFGGIWDVVVRTRAAEFPLTATLSVAGEKVSGTFATQMGSIPVTGTVAGKAITITMVAKTPQGDFPVKLTGDLEGDSIVNGKADVGGMGQGEWIAKRSKQ
jgi:hypothetical protein